MTDWESRFSTWSTAPGKTEKEKIERAIKGIKDAITASEDLKDIDVNVFVQGSYKNRVNVRQDSDVDVGVCCTSTFNSYYPPGTSRETFGNTKSDYTYTMFKAAIRKALNARFGGESVKEGNKAFDIKSNTYRVEADVVPLFEYRYYSKDGSFLKGVALRTAAENKQIINWPQQHYENGVQKNAATGRRYKSLVRIVKSVCNEMQGNGYVEAKPIPGFLIECLLWNIPDEAFQGDDWTTIVRDCLALMYGDVTKKKPLMEINNIKPLFSDSQKWTREQAEKFIIAAYAYLEF